MSDYTSVAPPQQTFNQSSAFAAAVQRAKQIAAKINPATTGGDRPKRALEDVIEPDPKKLASLPINSPPSQPVAQAVPPVASRPPQQSHNNMGNMPPSMGMPSSISGGPGGPVFNEDIKVPDKMVGLIIGRGGEQITRLQADSGCKIQMAPDAAGLPDRICSLSGTRDAINRAKELVLSIVQQRGRTEGLGGIDMGNLPMTQNNYAGAGMNMNMTMNTPNMTTQQGARNFVEIMVPGPKVGLIIGKGGETIKQLQEKSGAKMVVIQDGPNQEAEKPLRISGDATKVEYAKQLVYELIAEKEMQAYSRRGGGNSGRNQDDRQQQYNEYGGGGGGGGGGSNEMEVLVPRAAVGIVIGKGGDMIKKIQAETGARVQFQQAKDEGPGDRRCSVSGRPQQVDQARQRIEELIDSVLRREEGGGGGGHRGRGRDRYNNRGDRNGNQDYGGWDNSRQQQAPQEVTFTVPTSKCGVIIGRGGETIKQINQQSGAHCELDRRSQNHQDKTFTIRGEPSQIETAKRIISEKIQIPLNFVTSGQSNNLPTAYPGMAAQPYAGQNWGVPAFQQQWGQAPAPDTGVQAVGPVQVNPTTGQPDYSLQWAEYYRSIGLPSEAEAIEQQAKSKGVVPVAPVATPQVVQAPTPVVSTPVPGATANGGQTDYSEQWAQYYRGLGKLKEAEAIESQMKAKQVQSIPQPTAPSTPVVTGGTPQTQGAGVYQQSYATYPGAAVAGYYGGQNQAAPAPPAMPSQNQYGFGYNYGGAGGTAEN